MTSFHVLLLLVFLTILQRGVNGACQSCLLPAIHRHHHRHAPTVVAVALQRQPNQLYGSFLGLVALKSLQNNPIVKPVAIALAVLATQRYVSSIVLRADKEGAAGDKEEETTKDEEKGLPVTSAMVTTIGIYKNFISPLLPPACRFLPTCSQYGVQAIEEFGPSKGSVLTAWRLLRCSPFGGKGYDPPRWPPVAYNYGSY